MKRRNKFSLSNTKLFSCDMGELIPCGLLEVLPGDSIQQSTSALIRCSPMLAPVMHPVEVRIHHWFVPTRIIWDNFEGFITGGPDGNNADTVPTLSAPAAGGGFAIGTLADYLGVPTGVNSLVVNALPFRAYNLIWNEWYRDQDLQNPVVVSKGNGPDTTTSTLLQNGAWEKDYFTSARPWEQKGPVVTVPLGNRANIKGIGITDGTTTSAIPANSRQSDGTVMTGNRADSPASNVNFKSVTTGAIGVSNPPDIWADLSTASAVTVTLLRQALAIQRYEEGRARYGSRYAEYLAYLGVRSSDGRLSRPEYLGGGKQMIQFSEVLQTAEGVQPVGQMRGHGIAAMRSNRYRRFFEEHGYVLTLMSVRPKTIYANGLFRLWNRRTKFDFWQKELEAIGQQAIQVKELFCSTSPSIENTFGFQDRYDEYRRQESSIGGEFRSSLLDFWHMARIFASIPALNSSFVSCVPTERSFAVPSQDVLYIQARHSVQARRLVASTAKSFIY